MGDFFDYLMRRKPLLLLFLVAFVASGFFSYHVFIRSQTVLDRHMAETNQTTLTPPIEVKPDDFSLKEEPPVDSQTIFTYVQDPRATVLIFSEQAQEGPDSDTVAELETPPTSDTVVKSPLSSGINGDSDTAGAMQDNSELEVPRTGQTETTTPHHSHSIIAACMIILAVATILFGGYLLVLHFLR